MAENEKLQQVRNHKEKVSKVLFNNDFFEEKDGKEYPKNRLVVNLVSYSGEYLDRENKYQKYEGEKVVVFNTKLVLNNGNVETDKKIITFKDGKQKAVDNRQIISLSLEQFRELLTCELD